MKSNETRRCMNRIGVGKPTTFVDCVSACWNNAAMMKEYRRLTGHALGEDKRKPLEKMIDAATGYVPSAVDDAEARAFFEFVRDCIWLPLLAKEVAEALERDSSPLPLDEQFTCPKCGGHTFGTAFNVGGCHGYDEANDRECGFRWPRADDAKYFRARTA